MEHRAGPPPTPLRRLRAAGAAAPGRTGVTATARARGRLGAGTGTGPGPAPGPAPDSEAGTPKQKGMIYGTRSSPAEHPCHWQGFSGWSDFYCSDRALAAAQDQVAPVQQVGGGRRRAPSAILRLFRYAPPSAMARRAAETDGTTPVAAIRFASGGSAPADSSRTR